MGYSNRYQVSVTGVKPKILIYSICLTYQSNEKHAIMTRFPPQSSKMDLPRLLTWIFHSEWQIADVTSVP